MNTKVAPTLSQSVIGATGDSRVTLLGLGMMFIRLVKLTVSPAEEGDIAAVTEKLVTAEALSIVITSSSIEVPTLLGRQPNAFTRKRGAKSFSFERQSRALSHV